jgi:hypothetical protein
MSSIATNVSPRGQDATSLSGVTTASLLVVFLVATGIGAATGLVLDSAVNPVVLPSSQAFSAPSSQGLSATRCSYVLGVSRELRTLAPHWWSSCTLWLRRWRAALPPTRLLDSPRWRGQC